jgi:hypothetical protein
MSETLQTVEGARAAILGEIAGPTAVESVACSRLMSWPR